MKNNYAGQIQGFIRCGLVILVAYPTFMQALPESLQRFCKTIARMSRDAFETPDQYAKACESARHEHVLTFPEVRQFQQNMQNALTKKQLLEPVISDFYKKLDDPQSRKQWRFFATYQDVVCTWDIERIAVPVINQRTEQLATEVEEQLATKSPNEVVNLYFDGKGDGRAVDLYRASGFFGKKGRSGMLIRLRAHDKVFALIKNKSNDLRHQFYNDMATDVQAGKLIDDRDYQARYEQLLPYDQQPFRNLLTRVRTRQVNALGDQAYAKL